MNEPYGGKLISKLIDGSERQTALDSADITINIDSESARDVLNIVYGVFSPIEGFMNKDDFESVVHKRELANGLPWTIPVYFKLKDEEVKDISTGTRVLLANEDLGLKALLVVEEVYKFEPKVYCDNVFGTTSEEHPGVANCFTKDESIIGGEVYLIEQKNIPLHEYHKTPAETRDVFGANGWDTIVAFQTRNPAHLAHEYLQKAALEFVDGLFIQPITGKKKTGDFKDEVILKVYERLTSEFYPKNSTHLGTFSSRMNYAGPREAVFHAIARKNYGCTHFIVGRDHAGVKDFYDKMAAHQIFDEIGEIGMQIMKFSNAFYSPKLRMFTTDKVSPELKDDEKISPSGTYVRQLISEKNHDELSKFMRDEVVEVILGFDNPFVTENS